MTNYPRRAYGEENPNSGFPANGDRAAFGGYSWPGGVPTGFLSTTDYTSSFGQRNRVLMRRELVPLWNLAFEICDKKHRYCIWSVHDGEPWGPWGYENRAVSGTNYASGHSMGLSVDINAPYNPYSTTFESDMPPAMVADLESLGLFWGGRYTGQKYDAMHYGFCRAPGTIPQYIARARQLLGHEPPDPGDDDMPLSNEDIEKVADAVIKKMEKKTFRSNFVVNKDADGNPVEPYEKARDRNIFDTVGSANTNTSRIYLGKSQA